MREREQNNDIRKSKQGRMNEKKTEKKEKIELEKKKKKREKLLGMKRRN